MRTRPWANLEEVLMHHDLVPPFWPVIYDSKPDQSTCAVVWLAKYDTQRRLTKARSIDVLIVGKLPSRPGRRCCLSLPRQVARPTDDLDLEAVRNTVGYDRHRVPPYAYDSPERPLSRFRELEPVVAMRVGHAMV